MPLSVTSHSGTLAMALWLAWDRRTRRAALPALGLLALVGAALLPLISAQGGHGTQWIGAWPLSEALRTSRYSCA